MNLRKGYRKVTRSIGDLAGHDKAQWLSGSKRAPKKGHEKGYKKVTKGHERSRGD